MSNLDSKHLTHFYEEINPFNLLPLWERKVKLEPGSHCVPAHWPFSMMRPLLEKSVDLISKKEADRRVLVMENPSLRGTSFIANSLFAGQQIIMPGEIAPAHRHSPNALRFIVEGEGAYTCVRGEKIPMLPGDFIVTPNWSWHDHGNEGTHAVIWMDGLDTPFTSLFGAHFRENYPEDAYPLERSIGYSTHQLAYNLLPTSYGIHSPEDQEQVLIYPFSKTKEALNLWASDPKAPADKALGYKLRYSNPVNGKYPLLTMAAFMHLFPENFNGTPYRSTENQVFNVTQGNCQIKTANHTYDLNLHDVLVVPSWEKYTIKTDESCMLFCFSDRAAQQALGFWREEYLAI